MVGRSVCAAVVTIGHGVAALLGGGETGGETGGLTTGGVTGTAATDVVAVCNPAASARGLVRMNLVGDLARAVCFTWSIWCCRASSR